MSELYVKTNSSDEVAVSEVIEGLQLLDLSTASPAVTNTYDQDTAVDGQTVVSMTYDKNTVNAKFWLHFGTWQDYLLAKHEIYKLFGGREMHRLRTDTEPYVCEYVLPTAFELALIADGSHDATFTIPFDNPSGYRYSVNNSDAMAIEEFGMNRPLDADPEYHFTSATMRVFNASDIAIDPYEQRHDLKITIKFAGNSCKLTNATNSSSWTYTKAATQSDTIILDGIATTLNGKPASANTDYGTITLEPGWNTITATGTTAIDCTFSFPFIYLG